MSPLLRSRWGIVAGIFALALLGGAQEKEPEPLRAAFEKLPLGATPEQVRERVGSPRRIARQILYHRHIEVWIYDKPAPIRLQFDCRRGQNARLISQPARSASKGGPR